MPHATTPQPTSTERNRFAHELFAPLPDHYDRLAEWLSFGQNGRWRREMVGKIASVPGTAGPAQAGLVLDVASGTAGVALQIASRTSATVVGIDLTEPMLRHGRRNVARRGMADRITLVAGQAERLPFPDAIFDALTFTYLLRYVDDPQATLAELARVVRPGGRVASLEFLAPPSRFWRAAWWLYTRGVLPLAGWLTGGRAWRGVGHFLGPSISEHYLKYPVDWTVAAWQAARLKDVGVKTMSLGGGLVMWGTKVG